MTMIRDLVRKGVAEKMAEMEQEKSGTGPRSLSLTEGPLAPEIYQAAMTDFKFPTTLPLFRGSGDTQDPQNFVYGFLERLRLQGASDAITCRVFTTCLSGEAWEWYMKLPRGSIHAFEDLAKVFLARYTAVRPPRVTCDSLLEIRQGANEGTRTFVDRFVRVSRTVHNYSDDFALAAIRNGLQPGGAGTLRYDAFKRDFKTLQEFLIFAEGYIRAE
jgi:hypothetical protein